MSGALSRARMWRGGRGRTGILAGVDAAERADEILGEVLERQVERRTAADHDIVISGPHTRGRQPHHLPQPSPHAIALRRIADLLGNRKSHPHRSILPPSE